MDLASLSAGADWASDCGVNAKRAAHTASAGPMSALIPRAARDDSLELIPHPQRQLLILPHPGAVPPQLVIALEDHVVDRLVGEPEGCDPAGQGVVPDHTRGHPGLGVEALVPDERIEPLGR